MRRLLAGATLVVFLALGGASAAQASDAGGCTAMGPVAGGGILYSCKNSAGDLFWIIGSDHDHKPGH
jgi:hypothetical protein